MYLLIEMNRSLLWSPLMLWSETIFAGDFEMTMVMV